MRRSEPKRNRRARRRRSLLILLLILCLCGAGTLSYLGARELSERRAAQAFYASLAASADEASADAEPADAPTDLEAEAAAARSGIDFEAIWETCPDVVGWIRLEDSQIDYPIVLGDDNVYYLNHLPDGTANQSGSIMMDKANTGDFQDAVTILHGHHMRNGTMFGDLSDYKDEEYYLSHATLRLYTPEGDYDVAIFAAYTVNGYTYEYPTSFEDEASFDQFIRAAVSSTGYETDVEVRYGDRILMLSTCAYNFSGARFIVLGKILEDEA